jgi:hypothetical protein
MADRQSIAGGAAQFREQVDTYKGAVETETIHELLKIRAATSAIIGRSTNVLLLATAVIAAAGIWQFETLVEVIGYGGAVSVFVILMIAGFVGLAGRDFGQRVEMMMPSLVPIAAIAEQVASKHAERARALEQMARQSGTPLQPVDTEPDLTMVEASFAYPDTFITRWAFGVTPSDEEGSVYSQVLSNIAYQAIAQKLHLASLVFLFAIVTAALLFRHGYSIGDPAQRVEACFAAHLKSPPALRELGHTGILSHCFKSHDSLEKWNCVSEKLSARLPLAGAKQECRIVEEPKRDVAKPAGVKK